MSSLLYLLIFQSLLEVHGGYSFGIYRSKQIEQRTTLLRNRQDFFNLGVGTEVFSTPPTRWKASSELLFQNAFVGNTIWFGPEWELDMGPGIERFFLVGGTGLGTYFSFLIEDPGEGLSAGERFSSAVGLQFYIGPKFALGNDFDLFLQAAPRLFFGKISEYTIRAASHSWMGAVFALNMQLRFRKAGSPPASDSY